MLPFIIFRKPFKEVAVSLNKAPAYNTSALAFPPMNSKEALFIKSFREERFASAFISHCKNGLMRLLIVSFLEVNGMFSQLPFRSVRVRAEFSSVYGIESLTALEKWPLKLRSEKLPTGVFTKLCETFALMETLGRSLYFIFPSMDTTTSNGLSIL